MKSLLQKIKQFHFLSLPLCFASLVFLDYSFRLFYRFLGNTALLSKKPMLFTLCWAFLLTALISLLPKRGRRVAMMAAICFFSLLVIVHGAMYNIFGHLFSFADMNFAGDGAKFFSWSYLHLRKAVLLCVFLSILLMAFAAFLTEPKAGRWKVAYKRIAAVVLAVLAVVPIVLLHSRLTPAKEGTMWWGDTYLPNSDTAIYHEFSDPNRSAMLTGLYQYTFRNLIVSCGFGVDRQSVERLNEYFAARELGTGGDNAQTGTLAGKNFIMVMMESIDTWLVTPEFMPNLYELSQNGVTLERFYTPLYLTAGTFNTELISQTGMIPAPTGLAAASYATNAFPLSLANLFEAQGYTANSFHSANPSIYSRGAIHTNMGFEAYHNYEAMGMDDYQLDSQMIRGYPLMTANEPFFTYIITYSGHGPYNEEMQNIAAPHYERAQAAAAASGVKSSAENLDEYTRAIAHAMQTDEFVGELLDALEQDGKLSDTVLLFYADHYGKYMTDKDFLAQLKGIASGDPMELYHTPCFFYGGGLAPQKIEKYTSTVDLVPTIVNLFGLPADLRYYAGDDIFGDKGGVIPLPNYGWFDGETYYSAEYQGKTTAEIAAVSAEVQGRMSASMDALRCDYFSHWEN